MPRNGQGIYTLPIGNPVITGTTITSTWGNTTMQDIANALTGSVASDGQTTMSGPLNMGSNRINNVDNPVLPQDAATMDYVDTQVGDLGTMARQNADNVQIIGGSIQGVLLNLGGTTGQMYLPRGNASQRTNSPVGGILRFNTETVGSYQGFYEGWTPAGWQRFVTVNEGNYTIDYVLVGGGAGALDIGSSGNWNSGGGGGGKVLGSSADVIPGSSIWTIVIGGGGSPGVNGASTTITGVAEAVGGGTNPQSMFNPNGGTSGNGFAGGAGNGGSLNGQAGGGGGGAGAVGGNGSQPSEAYWLGGNGGAGTEILITGTSQVLAGGGGGGAYAQGGAGVHGGGNGTGGSFGGGSNGTANTGGGGGGVYGNGGLSGGSGVAFLKMLTANYSGDHTGSPQIIVSGDYTILKYTGSGTYIA